MRFLIRYIVLASLLLSTAVAFAAANTDTYGSQNKSGAFKASKYPEIVIFSTPWCPGCKAACEYMRENNIPFIQKDVDANENYLEELETRYKISAVPVIVIGKDDKILKGFVPEVFKKALKDVIVKRRYSSDMIGK